MIGQFLEKATSSALSETAAEIRQRIESRFNNGQKDDTPSRLTGMTLASTSPSPLNHHIDERKETDLTEVSGYGSVATAFQNKETEIRLPAGWTVQAPTQSNIAAACPHCANYNADKHVCDLFGEPIPMDERQTNPCKGIKFNRKRHRNLLGNLKRLRK